MKYYNLIFLLIPFSVTVYGQNVDQAMMDKDLEVSANILATIMKQSKVGQVMMLGHGNDVKGKYLPDYGVVFNVSSSRLKMMSFETSDDVKWDFDDKVKLKDADSDSGEHYLITSFKDFLTDYGSMIRQLKPEDKILIKTENRTNRDGWAVIASHKEMKINSGISAEVQIADLVAYEKGSVTRDKLLERIIVNEHTIDYAKEPQLEVFSSMLKRLYEVDLSDTYYMANSPDYDRMDKFGVTYYLKFYSSTVNDEDDYTLPTIAKKNVSKADRDKIVEEMYPNFLKGFKQNIMEYGHILKNIGPTEMIVFHIKLTSCEGCKMPGAVEVTTRKSVIDDYRNGILSLEKAIAQIQTKDIED